jgi:polysaccharide chain length determinant protein (PEP-CTERM system associated)
MHDEFEEVPSRSLEDYWAIVHRRRWWFLVPAFLCWAVAWGVGWLLPPTYRSEAVILVEQQKVPAQYVTPNITIDLQDRLQSMTQQILSRTRLQATINSYKLYSRRGWADMLLNSDDAVEQMRKDIHIDLVESPGHPGDLTAFKIAYSARSPELAQQVNSALTSLFIDENLKSQRQQSEDTTAFLTSQLSDARSQLEEQEAKVRGFKGKHFGDLPAQLETNVQILNGLQAQLDNNQRAFDSAKQQKLYLESLVKQYQILHGGSGGSQAPDSAEVLDRELLDLRARLAEARSRYTEDFPDVVALKQKIDETEQLKEEIESEISTNQKTVSESNAVDTTPDSQKPYETGPMVQTRSQLKAIDLEIQNHQRHIKEIESQIAAYRARLNLTPQTEVELADISRGYEESKANYNSLLQKQNQSQLATSLQRKEQGEQFRIIDPSSLPPKPSSPNRLGISLVGLALGVGTGLGLTALRELIDVRVWHEKDLEGLVPERVLVSIPRLGTPEEDRYHRIYGWLELGAAMGMIIAIAVGNLYAFYKG